MSHVVSQLSVMSICQDELGRMWFGTLEGINCYDGERITAFKASAEYPMLGNETFNIVSDKKGSILFTSDSMLIHYDIHKERFTQIRSNKSSTLYAHNNEIWMATRDSVFKWDATKHQLIPIFSHPTVINNIKQLYANRKNQLYIGTSKGLYQVNITQKHPVPTCVLPEVFINKIYEDSQNNLWVALYRDGMYKITPESTTKYISGKENSLSNNDVRDFIEDNSGNLWISTFYGLNKLDKQGNFTSYTKDILPGSLTHSSIYALYKDIQGTIWAGTFYGGVQYFNPEADLFTHYSENTTRNDCLNFFFIGKMAEDKRGDVWICTEGGGLNKLDRQTRRFTYYTADGKPNSIPINNLKCITYDDKLDRLYIGTHMKGLFSFDIPSGKIKRYENSVFTGSSILHIALYKDQLFVQTAKGLFTMNLATEVVTELFPYNKAKAEITFVIDSKGWIWIAKRSLLQHINLRNPKELHSYSYGEKGLGKFPITRMIEDKTGNIFLATCGSGLFRYDEKQDRFVGYTMEEGWLPSNYCYDIASSDQGHIIVSNEQGITFLYPEQKTTNTIDLKDKLNLSALNEGCGLLVCRDGEVFVGGTNGMTSFFESKLFNTPPSYDLYFSSLSVNDQIVHPDDISGILSKALPFSQQIDLTHDQNNIIINYTSNNYIGNLHNDLYEYQLEGFDTRWITNTDGKIVYTNLNSGNYTLVVREKNATGSAQSIRLQIVVHSAWYATGIAYISYLLIFSGLAFIFLRGRYMRMQLRLSLEKEKREKQMNEEIIQAKLQFFSNISHEFRTPLTLINSQIELLLQYKGLPSQINQRLQRIYRNTFQLRELISELLDFRKMERGGMRLKISQMDLIPFLESIHQEFQEQASLQNINFRFTSVTKPIIGWYDAKQLKRIVFNLLSNAFKYTPEGGEIVLAIEENEKGIEIKVTDTGQGISQEALPHIFERFYQSDHSSSKEPGTGIGLALTKGLVELHHGTIDALSASGYGSVFTVHLPKENVFTEDDYVTLTDASEQLSPNLVSSTASMPDEQESASSITMEEDTKDKLCILVVEDNEDLLQMLADLLTPLYKVVIALNGEEGLKKAQEENPDLILSDIMMPIMTGTEMCREIKNSFDLCHIPVILLTALTSEEKNIEGLQCGADDYMGKPFSNKLLIGKIANMLRNRTILKKKYSLLLKENPSIHRMEELIMNDIDKKFMTQLNQTIEKHMSNPEFDINLLAQEIGVSRTSLYNKLRALSSMTPNDFILQSRLKHAADLLQEHPELQVTEIAYQVGFSTLRYFRTCFKAQFGEAPQEYRNRHIKS